MQQNTGLGVITDTDVDEELYLRGITIKDTPPVPPIPPPSDPDNGIVVIPPNGKLPDDPYLPVIPPVIPPVVTPNGDVPYIPGAVVKKGLSKAVIAILAAGIFAIMFLGQEEPEPKPRQRPRKRREPEPEPDYEDYEEEEV